MKLLLWLVGGLSVLGGLRWWRRRRETHVSRKWMREWERRELDAAAAIDGPAWKFPVRKIVNEAAHFQTSKLRKRA